MIFGTSVQLVPQNENPLLISAIMGTVGLCGFFALFVGLR